MGFVLATPDNRVTEISEEKAKDLLVKQYGNDNFLEGLKNKESSCASVEGGILEYIDA